MTVDYASLISESKGRFSELVTAHKVSGETPKCAYHNEEYNVGIDVLPEQVEALKAKNGATFNLLIVGQSGLGKTTFINTLFGAPILSNGCHDVEEVVANTHFGKTSEVTVHKAFLREGDFNLDFTVIDSPGFGDFIDNQFTYLQITEYIDEQLRLYMFQGEQPNRKQRVDNRVHLCLYFMNASSRGLSPVDIELMKHISSRVNLIPVIPKADTLTTAETQEIKSLVRQIIAVQGISICEFIKDDEVRLKIAELMPYSVIGSESYVHNSEAGPSVLGRSYSWGIAEVENPLHCDVVKLRAVLMADNLIDLISTTESYYESCRTKLIKTRIKQLKEIFEGSELLAGVDFDELDNNAPDMCRILSKFNKPMVDELVIQWSPVFVQRQLIRKKWYNEMISHEEKRFKDWKRLLFAKQLSFNQEIDQIQTRIKQLSDDIHRLKRGHGKSPPDGALSSAVESKEQAQNVSKEAPAKDANEKE